MTSGITDLMELVRLQLGCPQVKPQDRFIADLGAESFDLMRLAAAVENHFDIVFQEEPLSRVRTVNDLWTLVKSTRS